MSLSKISEKFILNKLKLLKRGNLRLINYDGKVYHFGNLENSLQLILRLIIKILFKYNIRWQFSLGEAHINKDFYSTNLTNLIELTARNINLIYKFSGSLKLRTLKNFFKGSLLPIQNLKV